MVADKTLIDAFIEDQQRLTAVERFTQQHDTDELQLPSERYRDLLPATPPAAGEQYAFEVNLDKCTGCKACVTACHSLNGLDDDETWREVGLLIEAPRTRRNRVGVEVTKLTSNQSLLALAATSVQHVTTACHHCVDAACLNGCPVLAYDKHPLTGIVRHLDDQCIGCQYCVLKCPYDVPKYNSRLGIVRKCDMCSSRLAVNEAPACAQACPSEAIRITKVQTQTVTIEFRERAAEFLAGAPAGDYTLPTTRYVGSAELGVLTMPPMTVDRESRARRADGATHLVAADFAELKPQPAHWPLVLMLVLTQASVGAACVSLFSAELISLVWAALGFAGAGLIVSVFHLGRPLGAWRSFLNLRRSWMSREIVVFAGYPVLLGAALMNSKLGALAGVTGAFGAFCSAMIYVDTQRELWRARRTISLFFLTTSMLGTANALVIVPANRSFVVALATLTLLKLALELGVVRHNTDRLLTPMRKSALLVTGRFNGLAMTRCLAGLIGGVGIPVLLTTDGLAMPRAFALIALTTLITGELCERYLFFRCVVAPKMPGGWAA